MPFSNKPWGDFKESDYSLEQWHRVCLIHLHDGEPISKEQCKLTVREPNGTLNRNGIHAAAAALAGARGGVQAPLDKKRAAARQLVALYREMEEEPPESIKRLAGGHEYICRIVPAIGKDYGANGRSCGNSLEIEIEETLPQQILPDGCCTGGSQPESHKGQSL